MMISHIIREPRQKVSSGLDKKLTTYRYIFQFHVEAAQKSHQTKSKECKVIFRMWHFIALCAGVLEQFPEIKIHVEMILSSSQRILDLEGEERINQCFQPL